ncbi:MAG TPA: ABC transporter permease [Flavitalea sp.]|nr:ABC transporter permease [Flavitalea sp.]
MFKNYLLLAIRNLFKRKGYSFLNIAGLSIGMTACLLIFHYVSYERSFDDFHPDAGNIYRLRLDSYQKGTLAWKSATIYPAIAPTLKKDYPEVEDFCRLYDANLLLTNEETNVKFNEQKGYYADPSILHFFAVRIIKGNPEYALKGPDKMMISERMAKKYFGNSDPMGKKLTVRDPSSLQTYEVTGIFKDYPANSHLNIEYLVSYATLGKITQNEGDTTNPTETSFGWYDFYSYLKLRPGTDPQKFSEKFPAFCDRYINSEEWYKTNNVRCELSMMPLTDIHLYSNFNQEAEVNGNGQAVGFLFLVALFIIGIAWINYINLATARSVERAREVGVRKVLGANRGGLIRQFLVESFLLNLVAFLLALLFFFLLLPAFDNFTARQTNNSFSLTSFYWLLFIGVFVTGTLLAGIYPSIVLSGFQPISVLKGVFKGSPGGISLRKGLIVVQFITSVVLIAGTIVVYQQVNFMRKQNLGVNINRTLVLKGAESIQDSFYMNLYQPFKSELLKIPGIHSVVASTSVMGKEIYWTSSIRRPGNENQNSVTLYHLGIDYDFIPSYDLKVLAGRNFSAAFPSDKKAVLLNHKAVTLLGFKSPEEAITQTITRGRDTMQVAGVVSDYHHQGLQKIIDPMIFLLTPDTRNYYSVKITSADLKSTIGAVEKVWKKYFPADPVDYSFLDETFNNQYQSDVLFGKVFGIFSFLAIIIACFGLLGLSAYNVLQRSKEIGIRKVLGASVQNILVLLSKDFVLLILVALLLSIPVGWYIMHQWLQDFAFRITIGWWVFGIAGGLALLIALLTICLQALKAAVDNPVKSLRSE